MPLAEPALDAFVSVKVENEKVINSATKERQSLGDECLFFVVIFHRSVRKLFSRQTFQTQLEIVVRYIVWH